MLFIADALSDEEDDVSFTSFLLLVLHVIFTLTVAIDVSPLSLNVYSNVSVLSQVSFLGVYKRKSSLILFGVPASSTPTVPCVPCVNTSLAVALTPVSFAKTFIGFALPLVTFTSKSLFALRAPAVDVVVLVVVVLAFVFDVFVPHVPHVDVPHVVFVPHVPQVDVPHVDVPQVDVPQVDVPHVDVPHVDVPQVDVPHVDVPHVDVGQVDVPHVDVPQVDVGQVDVPHVDVGHVVFALEVFVPHVDVPHVDVPQVDVPHVDVPHVDVPQVDVPHVDVPHVDVPHVDVPQVDVPHVDVPHVDVGHVVAFVPHVVLQVLVGHAAQTCVKAPNSRPTVSNFLNFWIIFSLFYCYYSI